MQPAMNGKRAADQSLSMHTVLLTRSDVKALLDATAVVPALRRAFIALRGSE